MTGAYLYGPFTGLGLAVAALTCLLDQALKLWLLFVFDLDARGIVSVAPGVSLVLTWNTGISYGLFQQSSDLGRAILIGITVLAVIFLWAWLARAATRLTAFALALVIGGAIGNSIDRLAYGAVADFVLLYVPGTKFSWYVFNLADAAIVAGVAGLLYEAVAPARAAKAP